MKYERNRALENAITKVLSEAPSMKQQMHDAMERRKAAQESGSRSALVGATLRIRELSNKGKKKRPASTSSIPPQRGKISDIKSSISSKIEDKSPFPSGATEIKPEKKVNKNGGAMRIRKHKGVGSATSDASAFPISSSRKKTKSTLEKNIIPNNISSDEKHYFEPNNEKSVVKPAPTFHWNIPDEPEEVPEHNPYNNPTDFGLHFNPRQYKSYEHKWAIENFHKDPHKAVEIGPTELVKHIAGKAILHINDKKASLESRRNAHNMLQHIASHGNEEIMAHLQNHPSPQVKNIIARRTNNPKILKKYVDSHLSVFDRPEHVKTAVERYGKFSWLRKKIGTMVTRKVNRKIGKQQNSLTESKFKNALYEVRKKYGKNN